MQAEKSTLCGILYNIHLTIFRNSFNIDESLLEDHLLGISIAYSFFGKLLCLNNPKLASVTKIGGYFWMVKHF